MPYIRCDKDCKPAAGQLSEAGVPIEQPAQPVPISQKISCIEYDIYNGNYQRSMLKDGGAISGTNEAGDKTLKQPDILSGWNGDYEKLDVDNNPAICPSTGLSKQYASMFMVHQNKSDSNQWYIKRDVDNNPAPILCYVRRDEDNAVVPLIEQPDGTILINDELAVLAVQDDRDNVFVTEDHIYRIELEANTVLDQYVPDAEDPSIQMILDEMGRRLVFEDGILIRIEEL